MVEVRLYLLGSERRPGTLLLPLLCGTNEQQTAVSLFVVVVVVVVVVVIVLCFCVLLIKTDRIGLGYLPIVCQSPLRCDVLVF